MTPYNFIDLTEKEVRLIATPLFQRMRRIRQLALASLVYPGALHTRFDHTLGVCHVAGLMAQSLGLDDEERRLVRLAALLHDLGHGPFSHVSEHVLELYADRETLPANQKKEKIHELITAHLINHNECIVKLLGQNDCSQVVKLLSEGHGQPVLRQIVSGPLDADKQDYLLRDSQFCGVQYGIFDIHQLHRSLTLIGNHEEKELGVDLDGVHALEQYALAKYYMTLNVYRHRVRIISDQMIVRAICLGIDVDQIEELRTLYSYTGDPAFFDNYVNWDDARLAIRFSEGDHKKSACGEMLSRLEARQLHKLVFTARARDFEPEVAETLLAISKPASANLRKILEQGISEIIGDYFKKVSNANYIIVHGFDVKSVKTSSRNDEAGIMISGGNGPRPFEEESTLFASINEQYADGFVEVYAPIEWDSRAQRQKARRELKHTIHDALSSGAKDHNSSQGGQ
ncbi:MAG: HD domain-containing protein [Planctomycetaceae bacterium]